MEPDRTDSHEFSIRRAVPEDVPLILSFIRELAAYEKLSREVTATEEVLSKNLFTGRRTAEVIIGESRGIPVGFALFFHNFSTFLGKPGIYVEDLYLRPEARGRGYGRLMFAHLARLAVERNCGRLEWWVLDWNKPAIGFYRSLGAVAMEDWTVQRISGEALVSLVKTGLPG
jgi:GNAT superfamily N-acetyltransferase